MKYLYVCAEFFLRESGGKSFLPEVPDMQKKNGFLLEKKKRSSILCPAGVFTKGKGIFFPLMTVLPFPA